MGFLERLRLVLSLCRMHRHPSSEESYPRGFGEGFMALPGEPSPVFRRLKTTAGETVEQGPLQNFSADDLAKAED